MFSECNNFTFNFHGGGHPKNLGYIGGGGWGGGAKQEKGGERLSIKYHKLPSNPIQNEQSLMSKSS